MHRFYCLWEYDSDQMIHFPDSLSYSLENIPLLISRNSESPFPSTRVGRAIDYESIARTANLRVMNPSL
jgi:hypothetical protein